MKKIDKVALGERVRQQRENRQLSQDQLADLIGVGQATISRIETGSLAPSIGVAVGLADRLGMDLRLMVTGKTKG